MEPTNAFGVTPLEEEYEQATQEHAWLVQEITQTQQAYARLPQLNARLAYIEGWLVRAPAPPSQDGSAEDAPIEFKGIGTATVVLPEKEEEEPANANS